MDVTSSTSFERIQSDSRQRESRELSRGDHHHERVGRRRRGHHMRNDDISHDNIFHMQQRRRAADQDTLLAYRSSERTTLKIETQEGDRVRLKIRASESMSVSTARSDDDDQEVASMQLQAHASTRVSFRVKGELNADELAAIRSVIEQAGSLAESFYAGGADQAFGIASELNVDAEQLARVSIRMRAYSEGTYSLPSAALANPPVDETDDNSAAPATTAPVNNPEVNDTVATDAGTGETAAATPPATDAAADSATAAPAAAPVSVSANALQSIGQFLNGLLDSFGGGEQVSNTNLKLQVFSSLLFSLSELQEDRQQQDAAALAGETAGVLGEQQLPLDAVA